MENSSIFLQNNFGTSSTDNLSLTNQVNMSPGHRPTNMPNLNKFHSSSETNVKIPDERTSPAYLSAVLQNLSLNNPNGVSLEETRTLHQGPYLIKLKNLPKDISIREAHALFALASNVISIELIQEEHGGNNQNTNTASNASINKDGQNFDGQPSMEFVIIAKLVNINLALQYSSILNSKSELFGSDFPFKSYVELIDESTQQQMAIPQVVPQFGDYQFGTVTEGRSASIPPAQVPQSTKRASILPQKSRFSFSDPFTHEGSPQQQIGNMLTSSVPPQSLHSTNQSTQDLSLGSTTNIQQSDAGKSFLLMENDEISDSIWGGKGIPSIMTGFAGTPQPSTPGLDWAGNDRQGSSFFLPNPNVNSNVTSQTMDMTSSMTPQNMRQMAAPHGIVSAATPISNFNSVQQISPSAAQSIPRANSEMGVQNQKRNTFTPQPPALQTNQPQERPGTMSQGGTPQKMHPTRTPLTSKPSHPINGTIKNNGTSITSNLTTGQPTISQADLSLLAKVPPPANPADQNPPCNTLYVGNLPPDATEQELRQLFSSQEGFRRLSFRNKNNNGNGHGPMCFVEFEDISYATRALAELYGSQLQRTTATNKGGIRLSFSKNPLGVRGPNSRRSAPSSNTSINNNSGIAASGYFASGYNKN